jgi:hypothetical protein
VTSRAQSIFKTAGVAALVGVAVWLVVGQLRAAHHSNPDSSKLWFYNLSTRQLYAADADTVPPDTHNGNGVRAIVVTFAAGAATPNPKKSPISKPAPRN